MTISKTLLRELSIGAIIGVSVELLLGFGLFYLNGDLERSYPYLELTQMPGHQIAEILLLPLGSEVVWITGLLIQSSLFIILALGCIHIYQGLKTSLS